MNEDLIQTITEIADKISNPAPVSENNISVNVIGAGLAGCEAAWQIANRGILVNLYEMKPHRYSPAHKSENFAELVCSNSLRADGIHNAVGLLKQEMRLLNSLIINCAIDTRVPAGGALAVDRDGFSNMVTEKIITHPNIRVIRKEIMKIPYDEPTVIAAGPLVSDALADEILKITSREYLHFYDAAAPIVPFSSIDMSRAFFGARYGKGGDDYINCPMTKEEYSVFYNALISAELVPVHEEVDNPNVFEGCMPIEVMAKRGEDAIRYGPLKPVGLNNPHDNSRPYAVVQLRQDNSSGTLYNIVGFQTRLTFGEQKRVFSLIPALKNAEFIRYGVMHRNTFINSPKLLTQTFKMRDMFPFLYFAGQITGVEGYVESAASGLVAGINISKHLQNKEEIIFPPFTALGALSRYISDTSITNFQPMNINYGIMPPLENKIKDKKRKAELIADRSLYFFETGDGNNLPI